MKFAERIRRSNYCAAILLALCSATQFAIAQNGASAPYRKPLAFEVVSIRASKSSACCTSWAAKPDGYHVNGQTTWSTIMVAYFPGGIATWDGRLTGAPDWLYQQAYDIDARVSDADRPAWQKQGMSLERVPMLREMLRTMLADRYKMVAHRVPGEVNGFALVVAPHGPNLTKTTPGAALPAVGMKLPDGGIAVGTDRGEPVQWRYHSASIADLLDMLQNSAHAPIVDRTSLTGLYDFVLRCGELNPDHPDSCSGDPAHHWDLGSLGLRLTPIKVPLDTLVIDHIEKPSAN